MISMDTTNLDVKLISYMVWNSSFLAESLGNLICTDACPKGSAKVSGRGRDITEVVVMAELGHGFDMSCGSAQPLEDGSYICSFLHRDDSQLIFFIHPDKECLLGIVKYSTTRWPISVASTSLKETITLSAIIK